MEGKAQAPPKGSVTAGLWTVSNGRALIAGVTWPLEGLPTMDPPESDTLWFDNPSHWFGLNSLLPGLHRGATGGLGDWMGLEYWLGLKQLPFLKPSWYLFLRSLLCASNCAFLCSS